jgi:DNA polymerase III delta prime subunit
MISNKSSIVIPDERQLPNYKVIRGARADGTAMILRVDPKLQMTLNEARKRVVEKKWDYVAIVAGLPGAGKSTLAQTLARYLCPSFDSTYIAFTAEEFIEITNNCPEHSSVVLDESFASLNAKVSMSNDFIKIVNHLQLIRQKHLFIFLCLPNFFDLSKGVAVFRASHLFVAYPTEDGDRGRFLAFDRDAKRKLYIKGSKFMDYNAEKANYFGQFWQNDVVPEMIYEGLKKKHLTILRHEY